MVLVQMVPGVQLLSALHLVKDVQFLVLVELEVGVMDTPVSAQQMLMHQVGGIGELMEELVNQHTHHLVEEQQVLVDVVAMVVV